ncbi:hypothetical protein [Natrinema halophilum]|uniref:Uncharacterized protein n=1 Tax=Natrinema halophilum TaxID=1699371 RepID=A0A7D5H4F3_9EURY|nr:hypothetical protein [Natrinema halophilum]QLG47355.1 hypothetical protein HYG82_00110 [Natrinema halophilum]
MAWQKRAEMEALVGSIVDEKLEERENARESSGVSRRRTLGLAGVAGLGALGVGSRSVRADDGALHMSQSIDLSDNDLQNVAAIGGTLTDGNRIESLAGENLSVSEGQLNAVPGSSGGEIGDTIQNRLDEATTRLELVGGTGNNWRVGPAEPVGDPHLHGSFGLRFATDRPLYLGECQIEANLAGQFTPALYEYDPETDELVEQVDTITIQTTGRKQTIFLDFLAEEPGEYLLTRLIPFKKGNEGDENDNLEPAPDSAYKPTDDAIELRRGGYDGYTGDSKHGVTVHGGYNPYFTHYDGPSDTSDSHYYYHNLEISTTESV